MLDVLLDSLLDSLKLLPFLFLAYLLIEYVEHRAGSKFTGALARLGRFGPLAGSALGVIPQCGFSTAASNLYSGGLITFGTLIAIFASTSDEALPVLFANPGHYKDALLLILCKFVIGLAAGLLVDLVLFRRDPLPDRDEAHAHMHSHCSEDCCEHGIFHSALHHTLNIFLFLIIIITAANLAIFYIGEARISAIVGTGKFWSPIVTALLGFIPNCGSSVVLTELYVQGLITFGALVSGLTTNSGIALMVLFRVSESKKHGFIAALALFIAGVLSGMALQLIL